MALASREINLREQNKARAEKLTGLKLDFINGSNINFETLGYEAGKKYYIGYWGEIDETLSINDGKIIVRGQDNRVREHMTTLDPVNDFVVV